MICKISALHKNLHSNYIMYFIVHIIIHSGARHQDHFVVDLIVVSKACIMIDCGTDGPSGNLYISCLIYGLNYILVRFSTMSSIEISIL